MPNERSFPHFNTVTVEEVQQLHKREREMLAAFGATERELEIKESIQQQWVHDNIMFWEKRNEID